MNTTSPYVWETSPWENSYLRWEVLKLKNENNLLKAEVEQLKTLTVEMDKTINISQAGCRELKAEVERLTNNCNYLDQKLDEELDNSAKEGKQS